MKKRKTCAIVCYCDMPGTDGFEFLKALGDSDNYILFGGFTITEDKQTALKAFKLGANGSLERMMNLKRFFQFENFAYKIP